MDLLLLADENRKNEFLSAVSPTVFTTQWFDHLPVEENDLHADLLVDLLFENNPERINWLQQTRIPCVMVNWMENNVPDQLIRINGWPGFTGRELLECACPDEQIRLQAERIAGQMGRTIEWTPSEIPFISQSIVSGIINEAYLALQEDTATQEGIDTAMKLGTNYPFGPFEWAERIGHKNIVHFLDYNLRENTYGHVSILLKEKALAQ